MFADRYDPLQNEMVSILTPDGCCDESLRPDLDDEQIRTMYRQMLTMRLYDRKAVSMQRQGRFGTYAQMEGQEACMVASTCPLEPRDWIVTSYRETGAMWMHGVPLKLLSLYWMGNEFGSHMPEGVNVLPVSIPVGSHPCTPSASPTPASTGRTAAWRWRISVTAPPPRATCTRR